MTLQIQRALCLLKIPLIPQMKFYMFLVDSEVISEFVIRDELSHFVNYYEGIHFYV